MARKSTFKNMALAKETAAIAASTITSRAFLKGVNTAYDAFMKINQAQAANTESDE